MIKRVGAEASFVAFDLMRLNRGQSAHQPARATDWRISSPTGRGGRAMLESSTDPQPFARCNRMSPCGHSSFVCVRSDVRRSFLCDPRLIVRRFLLEA